MDEQDEQAAKNDVLRAQLRLREIQVARQREDFGPGAVAVASKLLRLSVSGPYDGMVEVFSCETGTALSLPVCDVGLLIAALQNLDRTA